MTQIKTCTCKHPFQDNKYGVGKRVFNSRQATNETHIKGYRCTVCKKELDK